MPALLAFTWVLVLYSLPIGGNAEVTPYPNEMSRILLAVSLALDRSVSVDGAMAAYGTEEDLATRDGRFYSDKAPGLSLAGAPVAWAARALLPRWGDTRYPDYWPLRNLLTWLLSTLPGALLPFLFLRGRTPLGEGETALAALLALTTPLLTYSTTWFSHVPAGALVAAAWALALDPGRDAGSTSRWRCFAGGAAAGFAVAVEYPTAILAGVIFVAMIGSRRRASDVAMFAGGALVGLLPALAYNALAFGSPLTTGYAFKSLARDAAVHATGLAGVTWPSAERLRGVLLGSSRGVLFYCPLLLLVPSGLVAMSRRDPVGARALAAASCLYLLFASGFVDWKGGWGAASRHLVPLVPLLLLPVGHAVAALRWTVAGRMIVTALAAVSLGNGLLSLAVSPHFPASFEAPLAQVSMRCLLDGVAMPNAVSGALGVHPLIVTALWAAAAAALVTWSLVALLPSRRPWAILPAALAICVASSLWVQWESSPGATREQEEIRAWYLERLGESAQSKEIWYSRP